MILRSLKKGRRDIHVKEKYQKEEFEDTKGVIRIRISKNRQHNGQNTHIQPKNE